MGDLIGQLPERPQGFKCTKLLVVSPYVQGDFFEMMQKRYRPKASRIVVDVSTPDKDLADCRERLGSAVCTTLRAKVTGLMHAKLFYLEFECVNRLTQRFLAWGSANATGAGFRRNGETLSVLRLRTTKDGPLLSYFRSIWEHDPTKEAEVTLAEPHSREDALDLVLSLPPLTLLPSGPSPAKEPSFDAWLQQGWLCHRYSPAQTFGTFRIPLLKALPKGGFDVQLASLDLVSEGESRFLRLPYLRLLRPEVANPGESGTSQSWRSRYFIETYLGYWCSDACVNALGSSFCQANPEVREAEAAFLRGLQGNPQALRKATDRATTLLKDRLKGAIQVARAAHEDPRDYLGQNLDEAIRRACAGASGRVSADVKRISNDLFRDIYVKGVSLEPMPRFQVDQGAWEELRRSWAEGLLLEGEKQKTRSLPWARLKGDLGASPEDLGDPEALLGFLDEHGVGSLLDYHLAEDEESEEE